MTTVLELPVAEETSSGRPPIHWCCLEQQDLPIFGLCGGLPRTQRRRYRNLTCPQCMELVRPHWTVCAACASHAGYYGT